jgi:signal transduction histidine kinase
MEGEGENRCGQNRRSLRGARWCKELIDSLPLPMAAFDTAGRIAFFNQAAAALGGPRLRVGMHLREFAARFRIRRPDGTPCGWESLPPYRSLKLGEVIGGEVFVGTIASGEELPAMAFAGPIRTPEGDVTGAVAALLDLRPARQLQRARDEFVAMLSHDLKNLLSSITIASELLTREQTGPLNETQRKAVALISSSSAKMRELLARFLDLSKMEMGRFEIEAALGDLGEVVREVVEAFAERTQEVGIQLKVNIVPLPEVLVDRERIAQVVLNLLDNALKFSPPGSTVEVATATDYYEARVSVRDEGPGIAPEEMPYVFDRFYQARKARKTGIGLGLAICRAIIEAHGGLIWAEGEPGRGSTFIFSLPLPPPL